MKNKDTLNYWQKISDNNPTEKAVKVNSMNDFTQMDADFILKHSDAATEILDLASGSGLILNKIHKRVKFITAVEKFPAFSKYIATGPNIEVVNMDILEYSSLKKYDLVTLFGVSQYFSREEISKIYNLCNTCLKETGKIIVKNQFGVSDNVLVSGYSNELNMEYFSEYRHIDIETGLLKDAGFRNIEVVDIYPPECNRWKNTHFYAIVADK